jgi:hypothetical protein
MGVLLASPSKKVSFVRERDGEPEGVIGICNMQSIYVVIVYLSRSHAVQKCVPLSPLAHFP